MVVDHSFTVFNASAGSGKTFTLVKEYLKLLLKSNNIEHFKHILAITFTNKAVGEMKDRIIETLKLFSKEDILKNPNTMFNQICEELPLRADMVHQKSKDILNSIVYNYSAFNVSTIDGFTHKLIQTFAHDLKIPLNFEVELDTETILSEAVDRLIDKAGIDKALTKVLVDFAIEKADDDKSWDVTYDFNKIAKLLINENDIKFLKTLENKSLGDFTSLKLNLRNKLKELEEQVVEISNSILTLFEEHGLQQNDFSSGYLPKYFESLSNKNFNVNFNLKWQENLLNDKALYPGRVSDRISLIINRIQPQIAEAFILTKQAIMQFDFLKAIYKNITPLSVLNAINQELIAIKQEQGKILISEFNSIISNEIKNQPTPFIYERIGEKFRHYFIDEFQDTSILQWENLIPLLENSLSSEGGTAMLVGDAKQAIYRWRGGKPEQFIGLFNNDNPFQVKKEIITLPTNYRSFKEIISFNNRFFAYLSKHVFSHYQYQELYDNAVQDQFLEYNGFVSLNFLNITQDVDRDSAYPEQVYETILQILDNGYSLEDICILVRKKKEGVAIANYLNQKEIPIISSETLLIFNSQEVVFINNILRLILQPNDLLLKLEVLNYLSNIYKIEDKHLFFEKHIHLELSEFFKSFLALEICFDLEAILQLPLFDIAEEIVRSFNLVKTSDAYVQSYLDTVLEYSQNKFSELEGFLDHVETKKDSLSIVTPAQQKAVQIMTIHKAKGLEFPVVIFPYADLNIYKEIEPKEWLPLEPNDFNGFKYALLNYSSKFENYGDVGKNIYDKHRSELELDNINLLYVTLTRPIEQLHIISKNDLNKKGDANLKTYSGLFINYLQANNVWNDSQSIYQFGDYKRIEKLENEPKEVTQQSEFISASMQDHQIKIVTNSGYLWNTKQQEAIEKGNLVHKIMSQIKTKNDIEFVINDYIDASIINKIQAKSLKQTINQIVDHPSLKNYFDADLIIYNERDILSSSGMVLRPDRLVINSKKEVVIIDYKTGQENQKYIAQLKSYEDILKTMGFITIKKILVFLDKNNIEVKEI